MVVTALWPIIFSEESFIVSEIIRLSVIATGFFCRVSVEPDHLDVQIKPEIYAAFEQGYKLENILAYARKNTLDKLIA